MFLERSWASTVLGASASGQAFARFTGHVQGRVISVPGRAVSPCARLNFVNQRYSLRCIAWLHTRMSLAQGRHASHRQVNRELHRDQHSRLNCLLSILDDGRFVQEILSLYPGVPAFANLRCGLWYLQNASNTCYFKSTDGHTGNWSFSTLRLNLHVAEACHLAGGCIIVDATRRGKTFPVRLPPTHQRRCFHRGPRSPAEAWRTAFTRARLQDAFSKTVPIWACVVNRAIEQCRRAHERGSAGDPPWDTRLHTPPFVSDAECTAVEQRVPGFLASFLAAYPGGDLPPALRSLRKPLRPLWISPQSHIVTNHVAQPPDLPFHPVILLSASVPALYWRRQVHLPPQHTPDGGTCRRDHASGKQSSAQARRNASDNGASEDDWGACADALQGQSQGSYMCAPPAALTATPTAHRTHHRAVSALNGSMSAPLVVAMRPSSSADMCPELGMTKRRGRGVSRLPSSGVTGTFSSPETRPTCQGACSGFLIAPRRGAAAPLAAPGSPNRRTRVPRHRMRGNGVIRSHHAGLRLPRMHTT